MAKKAYLVTTSLTVRVIMDETESDDIPTHILNKIEKKLHERLFNNELSENIADVVEDTEVPYDGVEAY